jgi:hypothetical protein
LRNNDLSNLFNNQAENVTTPAGTKNVLDFVMPTELVELPSKGKLYPVGHPLRDKTTIEIKQMTAKEEDILTSENFIKNGIVLEKLLDSIIVDKSIKSTDLVSSDRAAIFLAARISAYGSEYSVDVSCRECKTKKSYSYDLTKSPRVNGLKEEIEISENGTIKLTLPASGLPVELKSVIGKDEASLFDRASSADSLITSQLSMMVSSISSITDKEQIKQVLESLPVKDSKFLRVKYKEFMPTVTFPYKMECNKCGHSEELEAPITLEFFWPQQ